MLVFDDDRVLAGVDRHAIPVIDVDDKITTEPEVFNEANRLKVMLRTMKNLIGEYSNYATAYRNRCGKTPEQQQKYANYIDIISVLVGKSINHRWPAAVTPYGKVSEPVRAGCSIISGANRRNLSSVKIIIPSVWRHIWIL